MKKLAASSEKIRCSEGEYLHKIVKYILIQLSIWCWCLNRNIEQLNGRNSQGRNRNTSKNLLYGKASISNQ